MNWTKLVDRCELMVESDRTLLLNLLYEAEEELTRSVDLYEDKFTSTLASETDSVALPSEGDATYSLFRSPIVVLHNGVKLKAMHEYDFYFKSDNTKHAGTPIGYSIKNNTINLSHKAKIGDKITVIYYGIVNVHIGVSPSIPEQYHKDLCYYACYIAQLKRAPEVASAYMQLWLETIKNIKIEEGRRDIVYTIREEI